MEFETYFLVGNTVYDFGASNQKVPVVARTIFTLLYGFIYSHDTSKNIWATAEKALKLQTDIQQKYTTIGKIIFYEVLSFYLTEIRRNIAVLFVPYNLESYVHWRFHHNIYYSKINLFYMKYTSKN